MGFQYGVLGAGRQGTAAAYDMVVHGDADRVVLGDAELERARRAAERVNDLVGDDVAEPARVDASEPVSLRGFLAGLDGFLSAVPYRFNLGVTRAAIEAGTHMSDLGGNTELVHRQLELGPEAEAAGVTILPDCGLVPGMGSSLIAYGMALLDEPRTAYIWDGGIPQDPAPPWNYELSFHIEGLVNEYDGSAVFLRDGRPVEVACFDPDEYQLVDFPEPFGTLEAFVTAGGTSTMPWSFQGRLETLENRTLRYPGHAAQWKAFRDAGLFSREPVRVNGEEVVPRHLFHALLSPRIEAGPDFRDVVLVRILVQGRRRGQEAEAQVDLVDYFDEETGFTAMQRTTGWDAAICVELMVRGETPPGAVVREEVLDPGRFMAELGRRGFDLREEIRGGGG